MYSPHYGLVLVDGVAFDAARGIGRPQPKRSAAYADAYLSMRPTMFLGLATRLPEPRASLIWMAAQIAAGRPICPPSLRVCLAGSRPASVVGHDGRHRSMAFLRAIGDAEMPVQLALTNADADDLDAGAIAHLRAGMRRQGDGVLVPGPLFGAAMMGGRMVQSPNVGSSRAVAVSVRARVGPRHNGARSRSMPGLSARTGSRPGRRQARARMGPSY